MIKHNKREVWLRGSIESIPALLQPVAHALLQAREEVNEIMDEFPDTLLWENPVSVASPGFHLQHLAGVLDRLFTYAQGQALTQQQLNNLEMEGKMPQKEYNIDKLLEIFNLQVDKALVQLSKTNELTLTESCWVGRNKIPSTVIGLLVHAAEHTMRHTGQLLVTVKILKAGLKQN